MLVVSHGLFLIDMKLLLNGLPFIRRDNCRSIRKSDPLFFRPANRNEFSAFAFSLGVFIRPNLTGINRVFKDPKDGSCLPVGFFPFLRSPRSWNTEFVEYPANFLDTLTLFEEFEDETDYFVGTPFISCCINK